MSVWSKISPDQIKNRVFQALENNVSFHDENALGVPGSFLNTEVFNQDASFLSDAPFLSTLIKNPNHIGCHTFGSSESFFKGTQAIEGELINICAEDILKGELGEQDGYVASGGTESNIQAIWMYRNLFQAEHNAQLTDICIICSEDSHYSMAKAANLLSLSLYQFKVNPNDRSTVKEYLDEVIIKAKSEGKNYFIFVANMMTTMFGSVDSLEVISKVIKEHNLAFRLHIDGAYGGFYYPFSTENSSYTFQNPMISSFTLDAHKMAQSPYGTGIFLARKGLIHYTNTKQASYVEGEDYTLIGSRSGANAVAVWMILSTLGPHGWFEKIMVLQKRADWLAKELDRLSVDYIRHSGSNIVTINHKFVTPELAHTYGLVPDNHHKPQWYKVVVMDHVTVDKMTLLINELKNNLMSV